MLPYFPDDIANDFEEARQPMRTWRVDFGRGVIEGFTDGAEAIEQAIFLILHTERFEYEIFSWNYGVELQRLIGMPIPLVYVRIKRVISDALIQDDRIFAVDNFEFERDGSHVHVTFTVETEAGLVEAERTVMIHGG